MRKVVAAAFLSLDGVMESARSATQGGMSLSEQQNSAFPALLHPEARQLEAHPV